MTGISRVFFLAVLAHVGHRSLSSSGAPLENPFPLGTIGCLASDVCGPQEVCKDDLLFGSCQDVYTGFRSGSGARGFYNSNNDYDNAGADVFRLQTVEIEELEQTIWTLIRDGFTWQDAYTQCTLQNLLVAFKRGRRFSPRLCEDALGVRLPGDNSGSAWAGEANAEVAAVLRELMRSPDSVGGLNTANQDADDYPVFDRKSRRIAGPFLDERDLYSEDEKEGVPMYSLSEDDGSLDSLGSNKRDEFVQIHKYFDKSKGQRKRDPVLSAAMRGGDPYNFIAAFPEKAISRQGLDALTINSPYSSDTLGEELADGQGRETLNAPLEVEEDGKGVREEGGTFFDLSPDLVEVSPEGLETLDGRESIMGQGEETAPKPESEGGESVDEKPLELSPRDEATLERLLEGSLEPDQLPVEQQRRLSRFIETMISRLEMQGAEPTKDVPVAQGDPQDAPPSEHDPIATQVAAAAQAEVDLGVDSSRPSDAENTQMQVDKKSPSLPEDEGPDDTRDKNEAVVHTEYTYIKLNRDMDPEQAQTFLTNLTRLLHVPAGVANLNEVNGDQLIIKLAQDPEWNSSKLAREAQDNAEALYQETGLKVVDAGIGKGVTVEVQKKDHGYVVLTFILVGSIAGVVLAVTIIYLLKRHSRSRDKLAQLAATADGNEASKDYQDLCRQRMQSKASEKPEPLHAASRIGSVSESQVRSPSSRSSTSSWSEEPAASNMDISTGHVVLAYMEDHLKNQDRLDHEWEALAAYQADPCSTSVANDPANARKNRYSDVLPYDHSRVVLSASTNVSNSDYINASFITDHDPRNPAYICTQGPLPHTVADFWQMVWEQGSVVIVMLTKLQADDGTALCHRYWPEEGSDLYHIYEVHLVSEHIWCDDYLVRSFYLKNLQTNETRTVTQFHFLTWTHLTVPPSMKALLDFRRKVNKSFRGGSCPIVLHCNDGCGRSGTYCLVDMVLNRMAKGAKEIDMAATLEHMRDQRMNMVQTKEQFQFALSAVAEEVHAILKAMPQ